MSAWCGYRIQSGFMPGITNRIVRRSAEGSVVVVVVVVVVVAGWRIKASSGSGCGMAMMRASSHARLEATP